MLSKPSNNRGEEQYTGYRRATRCILTGLSVGIGRYSIMLIDSYWLIFDQLNL